MQMHEYLGRFREDIPMWLAKYNPGDKISFTDIMSGRQSYYPGFGQDGTLLKVGNMSHAVHSHLHLDYLNKYDKDIAQVNSITGYTSIGHIEWNIADILPNGLYRPNVQYPTLRSHMSFLNDHRPHYFTEILEREKGLDDTYGAARMAITIMRADGIDFYYQLFVREYHKSPWIFLLQDHGLGGNYDAFGKGGLLDAIMQKNDNHPLFVITDNRYATRIWDGYEQIYEVNRIVGGMHRNHRGLWRLTDHYNIYGTIQDHRKQSHIQYYDVDIVRTNPD